MAPDHIIEMMQALLVNALDEMTGESFESVFNQTVEDLELEGETLEEFEELVSNLIELSDPE